MKRYGFKTLHFYNISSSEILAVPLLTGAFPYCWPRPPQLIFILSFRTLWSMTVRSHFGGFCWYNINPEWGLCQGQGLGKKGPGSLMGQRVLLSMASSALSSVVLKVWHSSEWPLVVSGGFLWLVKGWSDGRLVQVGSQSPLVHWSNLISSLAWWPRCQEHAAVILLSPSLSFGFLDSL